MSRTLKALKKKRQGEYKLYLPRVDYERKARVAFEAGDMDRFRRYTEAAIEAKVQEAQEG